MSAVEEELLLARAALSRLFEPSDTVGLALVSAAGPTAALQIASGKVRLPPEIAAGIGWMLGTSSGASGTGAFTVALGRWMPLVADLARDRDPETIRRLGGELLIPEDPRWPEALRHLEAGMPLCLWVRGNLETGFPELNRTVAVVGSRDATGYGLSITGDIAAGLANRGYTIVSGGAYVMWTRLRVVLNLHFELREPARAPTNPNPLQRWNQARLGRQ